VQQQVDQLVSEFRNGQVNRRTFLKRAALLLGSAAMANALLLAASGAPVHEVAEAAGEIEGTAPATMSATLPATANALEIQTSLVSFKGNGDASGYLAKPSAAGTYPAVVVIQEWWGVDDHIKNVTERFAKIGYVAIAPDLYRGKVAKEPSDAMRLINTVQKDQALLDIQGAADYLLAMDSVTPKKAGIIGFCFGGGLAMLMSYKGQNVGAVVSFYGAGVSPSDSDIAAVTAPVLGLYGDKDTNFTTDLINGWAAKFKAAGKINEMVIYKDAPHAFFNDTRDSYRKEAAEDAWKRTLAWFDKYLIGGMNATMPATMAATSTQ
jgi:carboxymethylenebutenolidase